MLVNQTGLQIRSNDTVRTNGMYFSTFFGGSDDTWATPVTTHTYFRNIRLWGTSRASELQGTVVSGGSKMKPSLCIAGAAAFIMYHLI